MGGYKRYELYKDSVVEWIGEIPAEWTVKKLKYLSNVQLSNVDKKSVEREVSVRLCNYVDVYYNNIISEQIEFMEATAKTEQITRFQLRRNDVLITKDSESPTDIAIPAWVREDLEEVLCGYHLAHIRPLGTFNGRFLYFCLESIRLREQFYARANGVTRFGLSKDDIGIALFCVPTLDEQRRIVKFLDKRTDEIDVFISEKKLLISALEEQRLAIITEAVTKGLKRDVKTQQSGVEWIGEKPEHWQLFKLKHVLTQIEYGISESSKAEGEYKLLTMGNISNGEVKIPFTGSLDELDEKYLLNTNDLLFNRTNSLDQIAKVGIFRGSIEDKVTFASYLVRLKVNEKADAEFLNLLLNCHPFLSYARSFAIPSVSQANLNANRYTNLKIILPPIDEQRAIREWIVERSQHMIDTIAEINQQIDNLIEYRQSLIFEAVTGKIDVRSVVDEETITA